MENEYGSFGADEIDVKYMTRLKTVRKSFYDQESKLSTCDRPFFFGGGGRVVGKEQRPKGKKGMPYTISLNSSHLLPPQCFNLSTCYAASSYWEFNQLVERRDTCDF